MARGTMITKLSRLEKHARAMIMPDGRCGVCADHRLGKLVFVLPGDDPATQAPTICPRCGENANTYFIIEEAADPRLAGSGVVGAVA